LKLSVKEVVQRQYRYSEDEPYPSIFSDKRKHEREHEYARYTDCVEVFPIHVFVKKPIFDIGCRRKKAENREVSRKKVFVRGFFSVFGDVFVKNLKHCQPDEKKERDGSDIHEREIEKRPNPDDTARMVHPRRKLKKVRREGIGMSKEKE
jgi:hypothetical protein